jgi:hypothetical protein
LPEMNWILKTGMKLMNNFWSEKVDNLDLKIDDSSVKYEIV